LRTPCRFRRRTDRERRADKIGCNLVVSIHIRISQPEFAGGDHVLLWAGLWKTNALDIRLTDAIPKTAR
jgi:hypothetical protein